MKQTFVAFLTLLYVLLIGAELRAETYDYSAVVTLCTATCDDFVSMTVGSTITGSFEIDVGLSDTFGDADISSFHLEINNPTNPPGDPPTDPTTENPLILESGMGRAVSILVQLHDYSRFGLMFTERRALKACNPAGDSAIDPLPEWP